MQEVYSVTHSGDNFRSQQSLSILHRKDEMVMRVICAVITFGDGHPFSIAAYEGNLWFPSDSLPPVSPRGKPRGKGWNEDGNCLWDDDHLYLGPITLGQALAKGRNVPAVEAIDDLAGNSANDPTDVSTVGIDEVVSLANAMGSDEACYNPELLGEQGRSIMNATKTDETECGSPAAIGFELYATPQNTLQAYATLANNGSSLPQTVLNGKTRYHWTQSRANQIIRSDVAQTLTGALSNASAGWLQPEKSMFTTTDGMKTAIAYGDDWDDSDAGDVQYSSRYAAELWVEGQKT